MRDMAIDWDTADRTAIGQAVTSARLAHGWSKEEACRQAGGLSPTTWLRIEAGERVQDAKLVAAAQALELTLELPSTTPGEVVTIGHPPADRSRAISLEERVIALEEQLSRLLAEHDDDQGDQATTA